MMNENLTEAERAFLEKTLPEKNRRETLVKKEKKKKRVERLVKHRSIYAWLIIPVIAIPVIGMILMSIAYFQASSFFGGPETLAWFLQQDITPEIEATLKEAGLGWMKDFLFVMRYRYVIVLITAIITLSLVSLLLWLDSMSIQKKEKELEVILNEEE